MCVLSGLLYIRWCQKTRFCLWLKIKLIYVLYFGAKMRAMVELFFFFSGGGGIAYFIFIYVRLIQFIHLSRDKKGNASLGIFKRKNQ